MLVVGNEGVDVSESSRGRLPSDPRSALAVWPDVIAWAASCAGPLQPIDLGLLGAPVPNPRQVFALGLNYADHAAEGGAPKPEHPMVFTKFPARIASTWVAYADAGDVVAGLTVGPDLSERAVQNRKPAPQFSLGKSFPGFGPIGPLLVTPDEVADRDDVELVCMLNGEEVQRGSSRDLIFSVPTLIATISAIVPMYPGDLIFTGTPAGVGMSRQPPRFLRAGDELESTIEGIRTIRSRFFDQPSKNPENAEENASCQLKL